MLQAFALIDKVNLLGNVDGSPPHTRKRPRHQYDMHGLIGFKAGFRVREPFHDFLNDAHFALHGFFIAAQHVQGILGIILAKNAHGPVKCFAGFIKHFAHMRYNPKAGLVLHQYGLLGHAHGFVADALQINHHAQGADHKAQISGHGLGAGQQLQGHFVNFVFEGIYGCVIFYDRCGPAGVARCHGLAGVFKGNAHAGAHDQQPGTQ